MNNFEKVAASLSNISEQISKLDEQKKILSRRDFVALVAQLYTRRRALVAQLKAFLPMNRDSLRVQARYDYERGN